MPPRGRGGSNMMGRAAPAATSSSGAVNSNNNGGLAKTGEEPKRPVAPILTSYQALQRKAIIPPLYPDVKIHKCKPITEALHTMIDQMRNSRGRVRNSPYYIDSHHCEAFLDEKRDPLLINLGIKTDYFPSELVVRPNKKRLMMLYRKFNFGSDEAGVQRLEKLFKQGKDNFDDDDEDDENADNIFQDEHDEESDGDAYDAFQNYDDDEDYLDEEQVGDGDEGPTM